MNLKDLLADAMMNGNTANVLTAVGEALNEVQERNRCTRKHTEKEAYEKNKPFNEATILVFQARNIFIK